MTDDILSVIREAAEAQDCSGLDNSVGDVLDAAADEIERLQKANRNLLYTIERLGDQMLEAVARRD